MKLKKDTDKVPSSDPWYDLVHGGYLDPEELLSDPKDAKAVMDAAALIVEFFETVCEEC